MNIVFLTRFDPQNINNWSGTLYYMYNKLGEKHNLKIIGPEIVEQLTFFISNNSSKYKNIQIDKYIHRLNECKHSVNTVFFCMPFIVYERGLSKTCKTFGVDL